MRKMQELTDPKSCMSRAGDNEMTFVLLERDAAAPETIRFWAKKRVQLGKNTFYDPQIVEAFACADAMEQDQYWADRNVRRQELAEKKAAGTLTELERQEFGGLQKAYFDFLNMKFPQLRFAEAFRPNFVLEAVLHAVAPAQE